MHGQNQVYTIAIAILRDVYRCFIQKTCKTKRVNKISTGLVGDCAKVMSSGIKTKKA